MRRMLMAWSAALVFGGCSRDASELDRAEEGMLGRAGGRDVVVQSIAAPAPAPAPSQASVQPDSVPTGMVIRTGSVEVEVASVERGAEAVQALVQRLGGYVTNVSMQTGRERRREAQVTARVPAPRFDEAIAGLDPVGTVESVNVTAEDVGEEYADLEAQVRNRARLEQRLLELLETRTGQLEDVLAVERELARVRETIERHEGRLRYLRNRVGMSTLTVSLREPAPVLSTYEGENIFVEALRSAWRNFLGVIVWLIAALGVILPLALFAWLAWLLLRALRRVLRRRRWGRRGGAPGPKG